MLIKTPRDLALSVKKERRQQNLTQVELAGLSNVGNRFIVELEQGKQTIEIGKALHVCQMLGIFLSSTNQDQAECKKLPFA